MSPVLAGVATTLAAVLPQSAPRWPPMPDVESGEKVDYADWYERRVRDGYNLMQDAYPLYAEIFPGISEGDPENAKDLGFAGMMHNPADKDAVPAPWRPAEHPDWEQSYQEHRKLLETFREAAARPYSYFPPIYADSEGEFPTLLTVHVIHWKYFRSCAKGLLEEAWRAEGGEVDATRFRENCRAILGAVQQLEREPRMTTIHVAHMRTLTYDHLRWALKYGVFDGAQLEALYEMLSDVDTAPQAFVHNLLFRLAQVYDLIQVAADPRTPKNVGSRLLTDLLTQIRVGRIDAERTARVFREYFQFIERTAVLPFTPECSYALYKRGKDLQKDNVNNRMIWVYLPRYADEYGFWAGAEALRRAVRLLVALHLHHARSGGWPVTLDDLQPHPGDEFAIDPFGGKPFHYRIRDGQPFLYSAYVDCDDDGGRRPRRWNFRFETDEDDGDCLFWPTREPQ